MQLKEKDLVSLKKIAEDKTQTDIAIKKVTNFEIDPRALSVLPGWNVRVDTPRVREHIARLKRAIRNGATLPLLDVRVEGAHIYVVDGHCRLAAIMELIREGVDIKLIMVRKYEGNDADREAHMLTSASGLSLTRLEQGRAALRLERLGWSTEQIADRAGHSTTYIEQNLMLAKANSDVHILLISEMVSNKAALEAIRKHGERAGTVLAKKWDQAKAKGEGKVTDKALRAPTLKPAAAAKVRASIDSLFAEMSDDARQQIAGAADDTEIRVSARFLKEMLQAHEEANKPSTPKKQKKAAKEAADAAA